MIMRNFYTATLERHAKLSGEFATEPFETGWASEAIFFIRIEEAFSDVRVEAKAQISADGIHWIDEGTAFATIDRCGDFFIRLRHFGGWLRLVGNAAGEAEATIHLVLKE